MQFADDGIARLTLRTDRAGDGPAAGDGPGAGDGVILAEYIYAPTEPQVESPRPYALLRTLDGAAATAYRPADHVWHKGLSLALPVVGHENFWGGPTYVHGEGYLQQANNGAQVHRTFRHTAAAGVARVDETLDWVTEDGRTVLAEGRTLTARRLDAGTGAWALTWRSALRNIASEPLGFGSPTSKGRDNAGYAGIFWRGPAAWTGGEILGPGGPAGDSARGASAPWLAFVAPDRSAGVLMLDATASPSPAGHPWFARSEEYAGLNPAPFFSRETVLPPGDTLILAAAVVVGTAVVADLASTAGAALVTELRTAGADPTGLGEIPQIRSAAHRVSESGDELRIRAGRTAGIHAPGTDLDKDPA